MINFMNVLGFFKFSQKIEIDPAMQRRIAWVKKDVELFVQALLDDDSPMPIVVADVRQCLQTARDNSNSGSINYFKEWDSKGVYYLSIDGQNRTHAIRAFMNDTMRLTLTYGGKIYENILYSELPLEIRQELDSRTILVYYLTDKSRGELHTTFKRINSGVPLNQCEKINSLPSNVADIVRGISADYKDFWTKKILSLKYSRMHELEYIAQGLMYLHKGVATNSDFVDIEKFYDDNSSIPNSTHEKTLRRLLTDMDRCADTLKKGKKLTKAEYWVLYMAFYHLIVTEGVAYTLTDPNQFLKVAIEVHRKLVNSSEEAFSKDKRIAVKNGEEEPSKAAYYFFWISSGHRQGSVRNKWLVEYFPELQKVLLDGGLDDCMRYHVQAAA